MTGSLFISQKTQEIFRARSMAFVHHKGGTGKTTACLNIAGWLTKLNQRVLVLDLDPQANATTGLGIDLKTLQNTLYDVFQGQRDLSEVILETPSGVFLAPASLKLIQTEMALAHADNKLVFLKKLIIDISKHFNFILIDAPPGSNILMLNGITAADHVIIPLDTGVFAFETLESIKELILQLQDSLNISINIPIALLKTFSASFQHKFFTKGIKKMIHQFFQTNGLDDCEIFTVPFSKKICQAQMRGLPISHFAPRSSVGKVYHRIAKAILA